MSRKRFKVTGLWEKRDSLNRKFYTAKMDVDHMYELLDDMYDSGIERFDFTVWMSDAKQSKTSPDCTVVFTEMVESD